MTDIGARVALLVVVLAASGCKGSPERPPPAETNPMIRSYSNCAMKAARLREPAVGCIPDDGLAKAFGWCAQLRQVPAAELTTTEGEFLATVCRSVP